jgi:hypothetical protein
MGLRMKVDKLEDICNSLQILSDAPHREGVMDGEIYTSCTVVTALRIQH